MSTTNCTTHDSACDCREAAHAKEVANLRRAGDALRACLIEWCKCHNAAVNEDMDAIAAWDAMTNTPPPHWPDDVLARDGIINEPPPSPLAVALATPPFTASDAWPTTPANAPSAARSPQPPATTR